MRPGYILALLILLLGCGGPVAELAQPVQLEVSASNPVILPGTQTRLQARAIYDDGNWLDVTDQVVWSSSSGVASVAAGQATGQFPGEAELTAALDGLNGSTAILVTDVPLSGLQLELPGPALPGGVTIPARVTGHLRDGTSLDLTSQVDWSSSHPERAAVSPDGLSTWAPGEAVISARLGEISTQQTVSVTSAQLVSLQVTPDQPQLPIGRRLLLHAIGTYSDSSTIDLTEQVTWASLNPNSAVISNLAGRRGTVTAVALGTSTVRASLGSVQGSTTLTVTAAELVSLQISPALTRLPTGWVRQMAATGRFSDGSVRDVSHEVTWSTDYPTRLEVDAGGRIRALAKGNANVVVRQGTIVRKLRLSVDNARPAPFPVVLRNAVQAARRIVMAGSIRIDGVQAVNDGTPAPASLFGGDSVSWTPQGGTALITGQVRSSGTIDLQGYPPAGGAWPGSAGPEFPSFDIPALIAAHSTSPLLSLSPFGTVTLPPGDCFFLGNLTHNGDLVLDGASLYVDGDLSVNGTVSGHGQVVVSGQTSFFGSSFMSTRQPGLLVLSHGPIVLKGYNGTAALSALAVEPNLALARQTLRELQIALADPTTLLGPGSSVDLMGATLGQPTGATYSGRPNELLGQLLSVVSAQPAGRSRDFLVKRLGLRDIFSRSQHKATSIDAFLSQGQQTAIVDAVNDSIYKRSQALPALRSVLAQVDPDRPGAACFQGLLYSNQAIALLDEVDVVGAVVARDNGMGVVSWLPDGQPLDPGEVYLGPGARVLFVRDSFWEE
jgi:hypothetical protein